MVNSHWNYRLPSKISIYNWLCQAAAEIPVEKRHIVEKVSESEVSLLLPSLLFIRIHLKMFVRLWKQLLAFCECDQILQSSSCRDSQTSAAFSILKVILPHDIPILCYTNCDFFYPVSYAASLRTLSDFMLRSLIKWMNSYFHNPFLKNFSLMLLVSYS